MIISINKKEVVFDRFFRLQPVRLLAQRTNKHKDNNSIMTPNITPTSLALFVAFAQDSGQWAGVPLIGGNVDVGPALRGNLTQLKKAGLVQTDYDSVENLTWLMFLPAGEAFATELGIDLGSDYYPTNMAAFA